MKKIEFNVTGPDRKNLVTTIGEILGVKPKYLGMPTAAYDVGGFTVDRDGTAGETSGATRRQRHHPTAAGSGAGRTYHRNAAG